MAYVNFTGVASPSLFVPEVWHPYTLTSMPMALYASQTAQDADGESTFWIGKIVWADGGASKSLSKVYLYVASSSLSGTVTIGVQGITGASSPEGDGSWSGSTVDVVDPTTGVLTATFGATNPVLSHGDIKAIACTITSYTSGSLQFALCEGTTTNMQFPICTASGGAETFGTPIILLEATDGTIGTIEGANWASAVTATESFGYTGTDEFGNIIKLPYNAKASAIWYHGYCNNTVNGHYTARVYSSPLGTPSSVVTLADHDLFYLTGSSTSATRCTIIPLGTQITLTKDTEYAVTLQNIATASANLITNSWSVASATHWNPFMYYPSSSVTRDRTDDSSPSFTQDTLKIYSMGLVIDAIDDGSGGSSSSVSRGNIPVLWK